jgi:hypothetical protein
MSFFDAGWPRSPNLQILRSLKTIYEYVFASDLNRVALNSHTGIHGELSGRYVILPAVPGASNHFVVEFAFPERAAAMQTRAVDGVKLAADIGERDRFPLDREFSDHSSGDFVLAGGFQK